MPIGPAEIFLFCFLLILSIAFYYVVYDRARHGFTSITGSLYKQSQIVNRYMEITCIKDSELTKLSEEYNESCKDLGSKVKKL